MVRILSECLLTFLCLVWNSQVASWEVEILWIWNRFQRRTSGFWLQLLMKHFFLEADRRKTYIISRIQEFERLVPLKRSRNSSFGNSGPGIDSIPGLPDIKPAWAEEDRNIYIITMMVMIIHTYTHEWTESWGDCDYRYKERGEGWVRQREGRSICTDDGDTAMMMKIEPWRRYEDDELLLVHGEWSLVEREQRFWFASLPSELFLWGG